MAELGESPQQLSKPTEQTAPPEDPTRIAKQALLERALEDPQKLIPIALSFANPADPLFPLDEKIRTGKLNPATDFQINYPGNFAWVSKIEGTVRKYLKNPNNFSGSLPSDITPIIEVIKDQYQIPKPEQIIRALKTIRNGVVIKKDNPFFDGYGRPATQEESALLRKHPQLADPFGILYDMRLSIKSLPEEEKRPMVAAQFALFEQMIKDLSLTDKERALARQIALNIMRGGVRGRGGDSCLKEEIESMETAHVASILYPKEKERKEAFETPPNKQKIGIENTPPQPKKPPSAQPNDQERLKIL